MTIRVLVVDDSRFVRRAVTRMLGEDPEIAVVAEAAHGHEALEQVRVHTPDVITLDLEMPGKGGLEVLRQIMAERPTPVVLLSAHTRADASRTLEALAAGAVDFVDKSSVSPMDLHALGEELVRKVRLAASSHPGATASRARAAGSDDLEGWTDMRAIVIGASTGGPQAIQILLANLPRDLGFPILIVQHMPQRFTRAFADHLAARCDLPVQEAEGGDRLEAGRVLVAPGGHHAGLRLDDGALRIALTDGGPHDLHVPSIDVAASSAASLLGRAACLVVLTGMGSDGSEGARAVRRAGGLVVAQDEASSVIYGMPRAVAQAGLADRVLPLERMAGLIARLTPRGAR